MSKYLLMRDQVIWGPYSLDEIKGLGVLPSDLIWVNGLSTKWLAPTDYDEIAPLLGLSTRKTLPITEIKPQGDVLSAPEMPVREETGSGSNEDRPPSFNQRYSEFRKSHVLPKEPLSVQSGENPDSEKKQPIDTGHPDGYIIKVVIADDHTLYRDGVKLALSMKKDISIVGEAENGLQLLHLLKHNLPDVILLDIQMPIMDGISALASIRNRYPDLKVVMLTMHNEPSMVTNLMQSGANAYLTKTANSEVIYDAIKTCYYKSYYFNELTNISMLEKIRTGHNTPEMPPAPLVQRIEKPGHVVNLPELEEKVALRNKSRTRKALLITICILLLVAGGIYAGMSLLKTSDLKSAAGPSAQNNGKTDSLVSSQSAIQAASLPDTTADAIKEKRQAVDTLIGSKNSGKVIAADSLKKNKMDMAFKDNKKKEENSIHKTIQSSASQKATTNKIKTDTSGVLAYAHTPNTQSSIKDDPKKDLVKRNIKHLVSAIIDGYDHTPDGGVSNIKLTVYNETNYKIDQVTLEIRYLLPDQTIFKTEIVKSGPLSALSSQILFPPSGSNGVRVDCQITQITSNELQL